MNKLKTFADIDQALLGYIPAVKDTMGKGITLERMYPLMKAIGNPEKKLKIIHVAGTSGKTSTSYYITSLLVEAGQKVGLTVSPHVDSVAERVQINLQPIAEKEFAEQLSEFIGLIENAEIEPSYFELLVAFAYWYFVKKNVDYAVIETGMGGLLDGTNVAVRDDKLCVITDIGYDHMKVLGNTLSEIASQKAGIIHHNNHAIMFNQSPEILDIFQAWCKRYNAVLEVVERTTEAISGIDALPEYQQYNLTLAHKAFKYLAKRDGLPELTIQQLSQGMSIQVPGRMDEVEVGSKKVIMDGAHNGQKMEAFVSSLEKKYPKQNVAVLMGLKEDKQFSDVLSILRPVTSTLILTSFSGSQDMPFVGVEPKELAVEAKQIGYKNIIIEADCSLAYEKLLEQSENIVVITGSFYLIGQLRSNNKELQNVRH